MQHATPSRDVWRYEHTRSKTGPYRNEEYGNDRDSFDLLHRGPPKPGKHPNASADPGLSKSAFWDDPDAYRFGFANLEQLRDWFDDPKGRRAASKGKFPVAGPLRLRRYRVPEVDVIDGDHQVVFKPDRARLVEDRKPTDVYRH